jgi:4-amino-4-deoxy-L-arabinose transferase-like glycosyltransferase
MVAPSPGISRALIVAFACLLSLPFIHQPLHLDDYFYVDIAENVLHNPLFAQDMPYVFEGQHFQDLASHSHAPFVSYYIALAMVSLPDSLGEEAKLHLAFVIFPIIIGLSAYSLARAFSPHPLLVALLIQATPVVMVNSHTLMADVPALAFWLLALCGFHKWFTQGKSRHLALCVLASILATFTSYQSLSLVLLFALYAWLKGRTDRGVVLACALPILFVVAWFVFGYAHYGRFLPLNTASFAAGRGMFAPQQIAERIVAILAYIGATTLFPVGYLLVCLPWLRGRALALSLLASLGLVQVFAPDYTLYEKGMLVLFLWAALALSARIILSGISAWRRKEGASRDAETLFIASWFGLVFVYCVIVFFTSTARYALPLVPPAVIFVSREARRLLATGRMALIGLLAATLGQGTALSISDLQFAKIYTQIVGDVKLKYQGLPGKIWYGGEWGFRHYMKRAGFELIASDAGSPPVRGGDLIVLPQLASPYRLAQDLESMLIKVEERQYKPRWPLRLLDEGSHAGFHSVHWGLLPYSFSDANLEGLKVYQVSILSEKLPAALPTSGGTPEPYPTLVMEGGERKLALLGGVPMHITYEMMLPHAAKMTFGVRTLDESMRARIQEPVEFSVRVESEAGITAQVFSSVVTDKTPAERFTVDLSGFPAGKARVVFAAAATGSMEKGARAAWIDFLLLPSN